MNYVVVGFVIVAFLMYAIASILSPETVGQGLKISYRTLTDPNIGLIPLIIAATFRHLLSMRSQRIRRQYTVQER